MGHWWWAECVFLLVLYLYYNSGSLDDVNPVCFWLFLCFVFCFFLCVVVLQMSTVILGDKVPQRCTAWIIMCPFSLWADASKKKKNKTKKNVSGDFSFYLSVFLWFGVSLMFGVLLLQVWLVVTEAQHAFHRQSHLCKWQNLNALLLPRAFVVYRRDSDAWKTRRTACKERERDCHKSVQGTKTGDPRTVHSVYITDSDICSQGQDV